MNFQSSFLNPRGKTCYFHCFHFSLLFKRITIFCVLFFSLLYDPVLNADEPFVELERDAADLNTNEAGSAYEAGKEQLPALNFESILNFPLNYQVNPSTLPEQHALALEILFNQPVDVSIELLALMKKLQFAIAEQISLYGEDEFIKRMTARKKKFEISVEIPNVGRAELNSLGLHDKGRIFTRLIHYKTQISYFFLDASQIDLNFLNDHKEDFTDLEFQKETRLRKFLLGELRRYISIQKLWQKTTEWKYSPLRERMHSDTSPAPSENAPLHNTPHNNPLSKSEEIPFVASSEDKDEAIIDIDMNEVSREEMAGKEALYTRMWMKLLGDKEEAMKEHKDLDGRDVVVVWYESGNSLDPIPRITNVQEFNRPTTKLSFEYWKEYWWSVWEPPSMNEKYLDQKGLRKAKAFFTGDYLLGLSNALAQATFVTGISYIHFLSSGEFSSTPGLMALIWGASLGTLIKTYRNWLWWGSQEVQILKACLISLSFSYTLQIIDHGLDSLTWQKHLHLAQNYVANGVAKTTWNQLPLARKQIGENTRDLNIPKDFVIKFPKIHNWMALGFLTALRKIGVISKFWENPDVREKKLWTKGIQFHLKEPVELMFDQAGVEQQLAYLPLFGLKMADQLELKLNTPYGPVPLGFLLLWAHIPFVKYWTLRYLEVNNYPQASDYRKEWENEKFLGVPFLGFIVKQIPTLAKLFLTLPYHLVKRGVRAGLQKTEKGSELVLKADRYIRGVNNTKTLRICESLL